jgi:SAM-dependent methyltransferase
MKICLTCSSHISDKSWQCVNCGWNPAQNSDVVYFAPHISGATEGYDPAWYEELARLEINNFWFVARNRLIRWLAQQHLPNRANYMELGCGTGFVLQMLNKTFPHWCMSATEAQPEGIEFARSRVSSAVKFFQLDACAIPFRDEFDAVGAFDVIEHIRDDIKAIEQIYASLKPNGLFLLSVPQHMFLWSAYDEAGCHFRRYSARELKEKLEQAGFEILESMSFNSLLLPLMMLSRIRKKRGPRVNVDVLEELRLPRTLNLGLSVILQIEYFMLRYGIRFPFGGSRIVVARKIARRGEKLCCLIS